MNPTLIAAIQSFTLEARSRLEDEAEEQLQGLYGWLPDGSFGAGTALALPGAAETLARLRAYAAAEAEAGVDAARAREKLKRETAFTWLNRAVAFRMLEERRLLRPTLAKLHQSSAFVLWLAEQRGQSSLPASTPVDALGEGPIDTAYREFLTWQCEQLAAQVSVLFDPATLATRLCPRPPALRALVDALTAPALAEAWQAGNEEAIGWVYQGFNAQELQAAFAAARENKRKFEPDDIPAVTQLFTIRWVVRFLVENTLGRLWLEMHPDSRLAETLTYYAPPQNLQRRALRPVSEITFLDPCCGSMHFGLLAFDLFAEMYREERARAGQPGWPAQPSAAREEDIPALILAHNLHGIDIDLRAVQISALTLLLKARMLNAQTRATDHNLACANIEAITGGRLDALIRESRFANRIEEKVLRALGERVADSAHLGSLLRLDEDLKRLVRTERERTAISGQRELLLEGLTDDLFQSTRDLQSYFDQLADTLTTRLDAMIRAAGGAGQHAASEAAKGLRLLRLTQKRYDVVATNPPYLSGRKMNKRLATLMSEDYPEGKGDLYAAFILRGQELLAPDGLLGMLTMHSFMFISSYEDLRSRLRGEVAIETLAHYGGGLFAVGNPGTLQTAAFVLRREPDGARRENQVGTYFRLVRERDAEAKRLAFESALAALRASQPHPLVFHCRQGDFDAIPGRPWVYWLNLNIRSLFSGTQILGDVALPLVGLQTGENKRFLRMWWEVGMSSINFDARSCMETQQLPSRWYKYNKGGTPRPWLQPQKHVVNWWHNGAEIRCHPSTTAATNPNNSRQNETHFFRIGITWSDVSSKGFAARLSPGGFIHDVTGMTCFPGPSDLRMVLALMNSRIAKYLLSALNPTIHYQVGDIERLPVPGGRSAELDARVEQCVELARQDSRENETTYDFVQPLRSLAERAARQARLAGLEGEIDSEVSRLYGLNEADLAAIEQELNGPAPATEADDESGGAEEDDEEASGDLSPADWARSWVSYAVGIVLGRFTPGMPGGLGAGDFPPATVTAVRGLVDDDGILPSDAGHPQDLAARVAACLEHLLGAEAARERIHLATGAEGDPVQALRGWLDRFTGTPDRSFWRYHLQQYRQRPVYWPFQSPDRNFTIWVFQEKLGPNTLHTLRDLAQVRLNLVERMVTDLRTLAATQRGKAKELAAREEESDDLRAFLARLQVHIERGYTSCPDDGVRLNAAPLHDLLPSWPDTHAAWKELEAGDYDWAHQAMRHWPDRVTEACRANRSFAIAHGQEHLCPAEPPRPVRRRRQ